MRNEMTLVRARTGVNWTTTIFFLIIHAGAVAALFDFSWPALGVTALLWWVSGSLGIGMGYHRLLTHRGYKAPKPLEYFLTICGVLALQGGPIAWVALHRVHHAQTERAGDPHSPRDGFWWSHIGWMLVGNSMHSETAKLARYTPDLAKDRFYVWLSQWHFLLQVPLGVLLYALGGWQFVLWGICFRIAYSWHATWLVNSATHVWGSRRFETRDDSRNNWWVALLTFGEGWHNNHHAHPAAARHGLVWYEIDVNWYGIWVLKKLGLATSVRLVDVSGTALDTAAAARSLKQAA